MADIQLLFGVKGGGSISEGSGKDIARDIGKIVEQINDKPLEIKFKADEDSLNDLRSRVSEITSSLNLEFDISKIKDIASQIQDEFDKLTINVKMRGDGSGNGSGGGSGGSGKGAGGTKKPRKRKDSGSGDSGGGGDEDDSVGVNTLRSAYDTYKKMHSLLNSNKNFASTEAYSKLNKEVEKFEALLPSSIRELEDGIDPLDEDFSGISKGIQLSNAEVVKFVDNGKLAISEFSAEMEKAGQSGVSISKVYRDIGKAKTALNKTGGTDEARKNIEADLKILEDVKKDYINDLNDPRAAESLTKSFEKFGVVGTDVLSRIEENIERLGAEADRTAKRVDKVISPETKQTEIKKTPIATVDGVIAQANNLLNNNQNAAGLVKYKELEYAVKSTATAIDIARNNAIELGDTFDSYDTKEVDKLRGAIAALRKEMSEKKISGNPRQSTKKNTPIATVDNLIANATNLLNNNKNAAGLETYKSLETVVGNTKTTIEAARGEAEKLDKTFDSLDTKEVDKLREAVAALKREMAETGKSGNPAVAFSSLLQTEKNAYQLKAEKLVQKAEGLQSRYSAAKGMPAYNQISDAVSLFRDFEENFGSKTVQEIDEAFDDASEKILAAEGAIKKTGKATKSLSDRFGSLTKKFTEWFGVAQLISALWRALQRMVTSVIELDTAMTELKKVTDETDERYEKFLTDAASRAKKLGAALTDVVNASASFARLGYSIGEAEKMADAAIIYKNVGDGIQDINQASESIIATMQAFGIAADDVMTIVDKFNTIGRFLPIYTVMC